MVSDVLVKMLLEPNLPVMSLLVSQYLLNYACDNIFVVAFCLVITWLYL